MSIEYDNYLNEHRNNVKKSWEWIKENIPELAVYASECDELVNYGHDASKNDAFEYDAYDAYFYGNNKSFNVIQNFKHAWLQHIHNNPHHWQHWILINDDPNEGEVILEMPREYAIEMVCDWWAFSWAKDNLHEIFKWYHEHKDYIKLHPRTRAFVEDILERIGERLEGEIE